MNPLNFESSPIFESRWFARIVLLAAALLISPTFSFGLMTTTWRKAGIYTVLSTIYAVGFYVVYNKYAAIDPSGATSSDLNSLFDSLVVWTTIIGSVAPFLAGAILRYGWEGRDVRMAVSTACVSFAVLTYGSSLMTDRLNDLTTEVNLSAGKEMAFNTLMDIVGNDPASRTEGPEFWMARYLTTRLNNEINGYDGPKSMEDFREAILKHRAQMQSARQAQPGESAPQDSK